jgi:hypothetical protein
MQTSGGSGTNTLRTTCSDHGPCGLIHAFAPPTASTTMGKRPERSRCRISATTVADFTAGNAASVKSARCQFCSKRYHSLQSKSHWETLLTNRQSAQSTSSACILIHRNGHCQDGSDHCESVCSGRYFTTTRCGLCC